MSNPVSSAPPSSVEGTVTLKPKKDRALRRRHPWIFSGAIARAANMAPGAIVRVISSEGELLGRGAFSPSSQIRVRMLTFDDSAIDARLITARVDAAVSLRSGLVLDEHTTGARLLFGESDSLPGFIADLYGDTLVLQCQSALAERFRDDVVRALSAALPAVTRVLDRSDAEVRKLEGLAQRVEWLRGAARAELVEIQENGMRFLVDVEKGHKTGFYLDQRDSRARLRSLARGRTVLNCFSYTGGFSVAALVGGAAHATSVDTSAGALELAAKNVALNGIAPGAHETVKGDCFDVLRDLERAGSKFGVVVLDPPKFAPGAAHVEKAARGYKDLALRGLRLLEEGGLLLTFSCSGAITRELFAEILANAAAEARKSVRVLAPLGHALDHPVLTSFPEGEYLKGFLASVSSS